MQRLLTALLIAGQLSACLDLTACATDATIANLNNAKQGCLAGDRQQCIYQQQYEAQASSERKDNAGKVALAVVLVPLIVGVAVLSAAAENQSYGPGSTTTTCHSSMYSTTCRTW